jgi:CRP/FNR family transcriptional regulator, cyclic AMP receptor protein
MPCNANELRHVPLFSLLDEDELLVLSQQVELRDFAAKQRIYKAGEPGIRAFVMMSGSVEVSLLDEDGQEVVFSEPRHGDFFGFASMLEGVDHQTSAIATEPTTCLEVDRNDISVLLEKKPQAGLDMMTVLAREIHTAQAVIRARAMRNPNELIDEQETFGERIADKVASFGGSWSFIIMFGVTLVSYTIISNLMHNKSWDPYPYILLNLFLSMLAAIQAPVIMMSQNRQDHKDRVRSELDFEVNRRAEAEIQALSRKIHFLTDKLGDVEEHLRGPNEPRRDDDLQG